MDKKHLIWTTESENAPVSSFKKELVATTYSSKGVSGFEYQITSLKNTDNQHEHWFLHVLNSSKTEKFMSASVIKSLDEMKSIAETFEEEIHSVVLAALHDSEYAKKFLK